MVGQQKQNDPFSNAFGQCNLEADDDFGDFGDFEGANNDTSLPNPNINQHPQYLKSAMQDNDDGFGDFGNFEEPPKANEIQSMK